MHAYHNLLRAILAEGNDRGSRAGATRSTFGLQFRHNLAEGFPLLTTKKLPWKAIVVELLWFLKGDTNIKYLLENGVHIWSKDAYRVYCSKETHTNRKIHDIETFERLILEQPSFAQLYGDLGPIYGKQWRDWTYPSPDGDRTYFKDQIKEVIESIKSNPEGRRHIVVAYNPAEVDRMALPPCHAMFQFYVNQNRLSCHMYQRSADTFLGVPFNIASYALLTHIIAHQCGLDVGELIISFGDIHIYQIHMDAVKEQLSREPRKLPYLLNVPVFDGLHRRIDTYQIDDFLIQEYDPHPAIHGDLSVGI